MRLSKDVIGQITAKNLNTAPQVGGQVVRARYIPHTGQLVKWTEQSDRELILLENKVHYELCKAKPFFRTARAEMAGDYSLNIPSLDWEQLRKVFKKRHDADFYSAPVDERKKFMKELYDRRPEYRYA